MEEQPPEPGRPVDIFLGRDGLQGIPLVDPVDRQAARLRMKAAIERHSLPEVGNERRVIGPVPGEVAQHPAMVKGVDEDPGPQVLLGPRQEESGEIF